jgi:hypothetical protein
MTDYLDIDPDWAVRNREQSHSAGMADVELEGCGTQDRLAVRVDPDGYIPGGQIKIASEKNAQ